MAELVFTKKELFLDIEDDNLRNTNRTTFLFNLLEDTARKLAGKTVNLTLGAINTPENRHALISYIAHLPVTDRKTVMMGVLDKVRGNNAA